MPEHQNIEYKQSWHNDYLKWIADFANSQGGTIYIGKDDQGKIVGIADYKKLMEDLPNKIRNILGIMVEINLHEEKGKYYLKIVTPPYAVPISLRGAYYTRSGSTKQELKGNALIEDRWRKISYDEIITRDKISLDTTWIKDKSLADLDNLPDPDKLAEDMIENLEAGLASFREIMQNHDCNAAGIDRKYQ